MKPEAFCGEAEKVVSSQARREQISGFYPQSADIQCGIVPGAPGKPDRSVFVYPAGTSNLPAGMGSVEIFVAVWLIVIAPLRALVTLERVTSATPLT